MRTLLHTHTHMHTHNTRDLGLHQTFQEQLVLCSRAPGSHKWWSTCINYQWPAIQCCVTLCDQRDNGLTSVSLKLSSTFCSHGVSHEAPVRVNQLSSTISHRLPSLPNRLSVVGLWRLYAFPTGIHVTVTCHVWHGWLHVLCEMETVAQ